MLTSLANIGADTIGQQVDSRETQCTSLTDPDVSHYQYLDQIELRHYIGRALRDQTRVTCLTTMIAPGRKRTALRSSGPVAVCQDPETPTFDSITSGRRKSRRGRIPVNPSRVSSEHIRKIGERTRQLLAYLERETAEARVLSQSSPELGVAFEPMVRIIRRKRASRRLSRLYVPSTGTGESSGRVGRPGPSSPLAITTAGDKITALQARLDELWSREQQWRADVSYLRQALQRDSILPDGNVNRKEFEEQLVILDAQLSEIPWTRRGIQMRLHRVGKRCGMSAVLWSGRLAW